MKIKNFNYYIFDWDGCLADTLSLWLDIYQTTFKSFGVEITYREIVDECFGDWTGPSKFGIDNEKAKDAMLKAWRERFIEVKLNPNAKKVLQKLKERGKKIVIASSSKKQSILPVIKKHGLENLYEALLDADDVQKHKPDPELIYRSIEVMDGKKSQTVIVGDSDKDIIAGKNAGIQTVLYYPEHNRRIHDEKYQESLGADYSIEDLIEIIDSKSQITNHK